MRIIKCSFRPVCDSFKKIRIGIDLTSHSGSLMLAHPVHLHLALLALGGKPDAQIQRVALPHPLRVIRLASVGAGRASGDLLQYQTLVDQD